MIAGGQQSSYSPVEEENTSGQRRRKIIINSNINNNKGPFFRKVSLGENDMQSAVSIFSGQFETVKVSRVEKIRITHRELDILEFVLNMKFATIENIHFQFFRLPKEGGVSSSLRWARERVALLVKSEFLNPVRDVCHRTLYIVTQKGYFYLKNSRPQSNVSRPNASIDGRTYNHDQKMIDLRLSLESSGQVQKWISEKQLSELEEYRSLLPNEFRPDGLYIAENGDRVAFELEIARKSKDRYKEKIKRYVQVVTSDQSKSLISSVHYCCEDIKVLELIKSECQIFQSYFKFSLVSNFLK